MKDNDDDDDDAQSRLPAKAKASDLEDSRFKTSVPTE